MVGRMGGGLHFLEEIELKMAKMPPFTNLNYTVTQSETSLLYAICIACSQITHPFKSEDAISHVYVESIM